MDLKFNKEIVSVRETVYDGAGEQSVELDYILPDYYPEVFKLVKCEMSPKIISHSVSGDRINYDISVQLRILYCGENSNTLQCVTQKLTYSKSIELSKIYDSLVVNLSPKADYVNCRVVNQRRLDIRGAVTVKAKICAEQKKEVLSDAFGMNVQLKKHSIRYASNKITAFKQFVIEDSAQLPAASPEVLNIIKTTAIINQTDKKIIANKLVVKGDAAVNVLYACEKDKSGSLESVGFTFPFSQIIDMEGIAEDYFCGITLDVCDCDVKCTPGTDTLANEINCEITVAASVTALKEGTAEIVEDAYSTTYECDYTAAPMRIEQIPITLDFNCQAKTSIDYTESEIDCIYDAFAEVFNVNSTVNAAEQKLGVSGMVKYQAVVRNSDGMPVILEKDEAFECTYDLPEAAENSVAEPAISVTACSYTLTSPTNISLKADLKIDGNLYTCAATNVITDLTVDENAMKVEQEDFALKLYFANKDEDLWEIAKKYSSGVEAIMEENDLETPQPREGMLIIPILN
ncbi:MAG: DUF3794 domain-containing protein [Oscillospiraceae bacterium]|jgi:hypothetical protein|nr:DUF3794 domain-containing protein [Oscillospiraceae bacterium]